MSETYTYLILLTGAAVASILVAASVPSGPTMMTARSLETPPGQILIQAVGQATLVQRP